jgi:hypothetical protein
LATTPQSQLNASLFQTTRGIKHEVSQNTTGIAGMTALLGSAASIAGEADFTLVNKTGYTIREIYISPAAKANWGNDRMGNANLDNNKSRLFKFSDKASCDQDLKVVFEDGDAEVVWENIDLCTINKISIKYNRSTKMVSADSE